MTEEEVCCLRRRQMPTQNAPEDEGGECRDTGEDPGRKHCSQLGGHERRWMIRQLHEQAKRARFFLLAKCANGNEWKQQGYRDIERTESGHQNAVQRR